MQMNAYAYQVASILKDYSSAGWCAYALTWINYYRGSIDEAMTWIDKCDKAWESLGSKHKKAITLRMHGHIEKSRREFKEAARLYQEAISIYEDLGWYRNRSSLLADLGRLAHDQKDYNVAEKYYRKALKHLPKWFFQ